MGRLRRSQRLTGAQLAAMVAMSQPKISRIERGQGFVDPEDVGVIARALGADEDLVHILMSHAERSQDRMTDWRPAKFGFVGQQNTIMDWERSATRFRDFRMTLMPGLLQTSGYVKLVLQAFQRLGSIEVSGRTEQSLLATVAARLRRQEVLADRSKSFRFIVWEPVFKPGGYPPVEMLAQISHLRGVVEQRANVKVSVIPQEAPVEIPPQHGFNLLDESLVIVDLYNTGLISRSRKDVETYGRVFEALEEHAIAVEPFLDRYQDLYIDMLRAGRE
ncbi:helix-turn-helix domain-containing protein [Actinoplanes sp. NPDC048988]|uniref:helix-turn-helix domain-containing protein n=1 Tax=Actinoplanes sp. NPDC048988 TaxID=3363901 RepID=UPI003715B168